MVSMAPTSWMNMLERTKVQVKDSNYELFFDRALLDKNTALSTFTDEERRLTTEAINWASGEGQTLYRTVRGFSAYADALRILARLEGVAEDEIEALVRAKYEHVLCCQVYNSPGYTMNDEGKLSLLTIGTSRSTMSSNRTKNPQTITSSRWSAGRTESASGRIESGFQVIPSSARANPRIKIWVWFGAAVNTFKRSI